MNEERMRSVVMKEKVVNEVKGFEGGVASL